MKNIRPCPYCGGEVEMVKLNKKKKETKDFFRIQCMKCRALVAKGTGYPDEPESAAKERIKQYEAEINRIWSPLSSTKIKQSENAKYRDWVASKSKIFGPDDERNELHDISNKITPIKEE